MTLCTSLTHNPPTPPFLIPSSLTSLPLPPFVAPLPPYLLPSLTHQLEDWSLPAGWLDNTFSTAFARAFSSDLITLFLLFTSLSWRSRLWKKVTNKPLSPDSQSLQNYEASFIGWQLPWVLWAEWLQNSLVKARKIEVAGKIEVGSDPESYTVITIQRGHSDIDMKKIWTLFWSGKNHILWTSATSKTLF